MYLVCGEALFDVFSLESAARSNELGFTAIAGGSPFNVAVGLRRLGVEAALFGGLSSDYLGRAAPGARRRRRTAASWCPATPRPPWRWSASTPAARRNTSSAATAAPTARCAWNTCRRWMGGYAACTSAPIPGGDTGGRHLLALVRRERPAPGQPGSQRAPRPAAGHRPWRRRVEAFASHAHLIKASEEDLALLYPGRDSGEVARGWLNPRCRLVFVTHGGAGASVHCTHGSWSRPADTALPPRDTVGAGDTFQAATSPLRRLDADSPAG